MADRQNTGRPTSEADAEPSESSESPNAQRAARRTADRANREEEVEADELVHTRPGQHPQPAPTAPQSPRYPAWDIVTGESIWVGAGYWDQDDLEQHYYEFYGRSDLIRMLRGLAPTQRDTLGVTVSSSTRAIARALGSIDPRIGQRRVLLGPGKSIIAYLNNASLILS